MTCHCGLEGLEELTERKNTELLSHLESEEVANLCNKDVGGKNLAQMVKSAFLVSVEEAT